MATNIIGLSGATASNLSVIDLDASTLTFEGEGVSRTTATQTIKDWAILMSTPEGEDPIEIQLQNRKGKSHVASKVTFNLVAYSDADTLRERPTNITATLVFERRAAAEGPALPITGDQYVQCVGLLYRFLVSDSTNVAGSATRISALQGGYKNVV